jgi:antitoxin PrlF
MQSTLTSKGQATIPKEVREYLGIKPGDTVKFFFGAKGEVYMLPTTDIMSVAGILYRPGRKPASIKQMNEAAMDYAAQQDQRTKTPPAKRGTRDASRKVR